MSKKVILFFIAGMNPTDAEREAAANLGTKRFRNARLAQIGSVEKCDAVAGLVPDAYRNVDGIEVIESTPKRGPGRPRGRPKAE